jgi:hypothetical protein
MLVFSLYSLIWGGLLYCTGAITSGYHMMEDHEIIDNQKTIGSQAIGKVILRETFNDLRNRFTPLFNIYHLSFSHFFGLNFLPWHLYLLFLLVLASACLFTFSCLNGISALLSFLLPLIILSGSQIEVVLRLATNELMGLTALSIALLTVKVSENSSKHKTCMEITCHVAAFFACCAKENFVLIVPVISLLKLYYSFLLNGTGLFQTIRRCLVFIGIQASILLFSVCMILFYISNTNESVYAGGDFSVLVFLQITFMYLQENLHPVTFFYSPWPYFVLLLAAIVLLLLRVKLITVRYRTELVFWGGLCCYAFACQYFVLYKVGFSGRYLLPFTVFLGIFIVSLLNRLQIIYFSRLVGFICIGLLVILVAQKFLQGYQLANNYTKEGDAIKLCVDKIVKYDTSGSPVLIVADDLLHIEMALAIMKYVQNKASNIEFSMIALAGDQQRFMKIADVYDSSLVPFQRKEFHKYYKAFIARAQKPSSYKQILILSYCRAPFLKRSTSELTLADYTETSLGEDYYRFDLLQLKRDL